VELQGVSPLRFSVERGVDFGQFEKSLGQFEAFDL
jgi:hypothetical protein